MPDEKRENGPGAVSGDGDGAAREPGPPAPEEEEPEERQPITLDRYMSRRRGRSAVSWPHVGALIVMLAILVALVMFKDRCGDAVSNMIFMLNPDAGQQPAKVRIELERPASKPSK